MGSVQKTKILITGKNSYVGTQFEQYVRNRKDSDEYEIHKISVRDEQWKEMDFGVYDVILHVAGLVHKNGKKKTAKEYKEINSILPFELAKKAKKEGCAQFIFLSSVSVYGMDHGKITKETVEKPTSYYGKSKLLAEKNLIRLQSNDFLVAIIRPPMIYGEGCPGNYASLEKLAKVTRIFPKVKNKRSMLNVETLSEYLLTIIQKKKSGVFLPQDEEYHCTSELMVELGEKYGRKIWLVSGFEWFFCLLKKQNGLIGSVINKIFGDLYIEM